MPHFVSGINFPVSLQSPSTSFQPLCLRLTCLCPYHIFSLCQLTTVTVDNSISLSLSAQNLPLSQIFPTIDSLPASGLTPRTLHCTTGPFFLSISVFSERELRCMLSPVRLSSVCNVHAPTQLVEIFSNISTPFDAFATR